MHPAIIERWQRATRSGRSPPFMHRQEGKLRFAFTLGNYFSLDFVPFNGCLFKTHFIA
jgi:hypothetical protein